MSARGNGFRRNASKALYGRQSRRGISGRSFHHCALLDSPAVLAHCDMDLQQTAARSEVQEALRESGSGRRELRGKVEAVG